MGNEQNLAYLILSKGVLGEWFRQFEAESKEQQADLLIYWEI